MRKTPPKKQLKTRRKKGAESRQIDSDVIRFAASFFTAKKFNFFQSLALAGFLLVGIFAFSAIALFPEEAEFEIFPAKVEGDWANQENSLFRDLAKNSTLDEFGIDNSAFTGSFKSNSEIDRVEEEGIGKEERSEDAEEGAVEEPEDVQEDESESADDQNESATEESEEGEADTGTDTDEQGEEEEAPAEEDSSSDPSSEILPEEETPIEVEVPSEESVLSEPANETQNSPDPETQSTEEVSLNLAKKFFSWLATTYKASAEDVLEQGDDDFQNAEDSSLELFTNQKSITFSGFDLPEEKKDLKRAAIGISLAFDGKEGNHDEVAVEWSLDGEKWSNPLAFRQNFHHSNGLNAGYTFAYLPSSVIWDDLSNLKVRVIHLTNGAEDEDLFVFVDALWLDVTVAGSEDLPKVDLEDASDVVRGKRNFVASEEVVLTIKKPNWSKEKIKELIKDKKVTLEEGSMEQFEESPKLADSMKVTGKAFAKKVVDTAESGASAIVDLFPGKDKKEDKESPEEAPVEESATTTSTEPIVTDPVSSGSTTEEAPEAEDEEPAEEESATSSEDVSFLPKAPKNLFGLDAFRLPGVSVADAKKDPVTIKIFDPQGEEYMDFKVDSKDDGTFDLHMEKSERGFKPGKYRVEMELEDDNAVLVSSYEFTWGVLAINVNKSIYSKGEIAYIQMGVVDESGDTVCDADLELTINGPSGATVNLYTANDTIMYSDECDGNTATSKPDYYGYTILPDEIGEFTMSMTAFTKNRTTTISYTF